MAHLDLALAVIRERSPNLASLVARYLRTLLRAGIRELCRAGARGASA